MRWTAVPSLLGAAASVLLALFPRHAGAQAADALPPELAVVQAQENRAKVISVMEETYSLTPLEAERLLHDVSSDTLRHVRLKEMVTAGQAKLERLLLVRTKDGQRAVVQHVQEVRFAAGYHFPSPPAPAEGQLIFTAAKPVTIPADPNLIIPTSFETRDVGDTLEVEPQISEDGFSVDLNLTVQAVRRAGDRTIQDQPVVKVPVFEMSKVNASVRVRDGEPYLLGTLNAGPANTPGLPAKEPRVYLDFLIVDIVRPEQINAVSKRAAAVIARAQAITVPKIEFRDATLNDVVDFLRTKGRELDPSKKGVNFLVKPGPKEKEVKITLNLTEVSLYDATRYVANLATYVVEAEESALLLRPAGGP